MHPREFIKKWGIEREDFKRMFPDKPSPTLNRWLGSRCPADIQDQIDVIDAILMSLSSIHENAPHVFEIYLTSLKKRS